MLNVYTWDQNLLSKQSERSEFFKSSSTSISTSSTREDRSSVIWLLTASRCTISYWECACVEQTRTLRCFRTSTLISSRRLNTSRSAGWRRTGRCTWIIPDHVPKMNLANLSRGQGILPQKNIFWRGQTTQIGLWKSKVDWSPLSLGGHSSFPWTFTNN